MAQGHYWRIIIHLDSWKHAYFTSFVAEWWTLWARWQTVWALISGWQLLFASETTSVFTQLDTDISRTTSRSIERRLRIQYLHLSPTFPLPATLSQTLANTGAPGKTSVWHYKLQGDVSCRFYTVVWMEKTKLDSHWQTQVDQNYCVRGLKDEVTQQGMPLFSTLHVKIWSPTVPNLLW